MVVQFLSTMSANDRLTLRERSIGSRLPYAQHVDDRTIATKDGLLMQVLHLGGFPFETVESGELNYRKTLRDSMLRAIGSSRFAVYHHIVRRLVDPVLDAEYPDPFSQELNNAWRDRMVSKQLYINDLFLTLVRRPLQGKGGIVDRWAQKLGFGSAAAGTDLSAERNALNGAMDQLVAGLSQYNPRILSAYGATNGSFSEPLEFLSLLLNGEMRPVKLPECEISEYLPYRRISFGQDLVEHSSAGMLPRQFTSILSVKDYPGQTTPGMLDDLLRLPFEMVISQSFGFVDRGPALAQMGLTLRRMRASDDEAHSLRSELSSAKDDVAAGRAAYGEHHLTIAVRSADMATVDDGIAEIQAAVGDLGVIAVREDIGLEAAYWAQFPANAKFIARRALISSRNFACLASGHNFPVGQARNNHWGEAVTVLETTAAGPYYFNFHKGDLGNFTVIGPSGSGKTVVLNFLLAQSLKYRPRIVFFDKDRGAELFIRSINGAYQVLRPGMPAGINPLQLPDTPENRRFLLDWIARLITGPSEVLAPEETERVKDALDASFAAAPEYRRLRYFVGLLRGSQRPHETDLWSRLRPWWGDGEHAWLFDNAVDQTDLTRRSVGFDMTLILDEPALRTPAMMYLFHRVEERLDGNPSIIVIDEGWKALDDDVFVHRIKDWEKTIRKRNGIVGFATQSAEDALSSKIASTIVEQAATQIFMANPKAKAEDYCDGFGLTPHEHALIRSLPDDSRCFLIKHVNRRANGTPYRRAKGTP
ncbi:MAG: VirB4 family type IV secretion/conjugal transfer ATPase, partial [Pseudomonadota bacterium]